MIEDILVESYEINYVIDYIVMNLSKKTENQFFDKSFGENLTSNFYILINRKILSVIHKGEYCEFQNKFQEIKPVIKEEIIKEEDRGIEINENQKHLDEIQNIDREDNYEKKDEETLMIEESRKEEIKIESIEKRQQIQFIGYNFPFIYELD